MRITHILPGFTKGGAERVVVELANQAVVAGHEVTVLAAYPVDPALLRNTLRPDVEVRYLTRSRFPRVKRYVALLPWLWRRRRWLLEQDIVHCHLTFGTVAGTAVQMVRRLAGGDRPCVIETFHGVGMPISPRVRAVSRMLAARRDGYALMAEDEYWGAFAKRYPDLPIAFIPNGISTDLPQVSAAQRARYLEESGIPDRRGLLVGTIGRLVGERKPLAMLEAFREIGRIAGEDVHFLMAGEGPMMDELKAAGDRLGLFGRLHLPGLVREPATVLSVLDLYVSVNVGAVTGIAGLEAAATGVPVIAVQALDDYDGEGDWIWSSKDPAALAEKAVHLLRDRDGAQALAERQRSHVEANLSSEAMARAYEALYARAGAG